MIESNTMVGTGTGMKVTCERDELVAKVSLVARAVSTRTAVQILSGILLRAEAGELHLAATDMELSLRASLAAQVEDEGAAVVPGRLLVDIARLLPENEVAIEHRPEEGSVRITCGTASYRLHTYNAEDFPRLVDVEALQTFSVDREPLLETINRVSRSASRDESRPVLTGILARFETGKLVMAATDSYRLSVKETPLEGELTVAAQTQDVGEARESMPVQFAGEPLEIGFNAEFLRDGIEAVTSDELQLKLISPLRPGLLTSADDDFWYLIMPIRLAG